MTQALEDLRNQHDEQVKLYKMELEQTYQAKVTTAVHSTVRLEARFVRLKTTSTSSTALKETSNYNLRKFCPSVQMPSLGPVCWCISREGIARGNSKQ